MEFKIGKWLLSNEVPAQRICNVNSMDSKSLIDAAPAIADAIRSAIAHGRADSLVNEIRGQTRTQ